jgi:hypothetical protein
VPPQLTDERLAWLAVRNDLNNQSRPNSLRTFLQRLGRSRTAGSIYTSRGAYGQVNQADDFTSRKMQTYAIAVDELSRRLSKDERAVLRSTGKVPAWFLPAINEEAGKIKLG